MWLLITDDCFDDHKRENDFAALKNSKHSREYCVGSLQIILSCGLKRKDKLRPVYNDAPERLSSTEGRASEESARKIPDKSSPALPSGSIE